MYPSLYPICAGQRPRTSIVAGFITHEEFRGSTQYASGIRKCSGAFEIAGPGDRLSLSTYLGEGLHFQEHQVKT